jgi:hypothetical protein
VDATTHAKVNSASLLFDLDFKFHDVSQAYSLCPGLMVVSELCRQPMQTGKVKNTPTTCSNDESRSICFIGAACGGGSFVWWREFARGAEVTSQALPYKLV